MSISKDELNQIVSEHNKWLLSNGRRGKRARLEGVVLSHLSLEGIDLRKSELVCVTMRMCSVESAIFNGADIVECNFELCAAHNTLFNNATIERSTFSNCDFTESKFESATLTRSNFVSCDFYTASMRKCLISDCEFVKVNLCGASFRNSSIRRTKLNVTDISCVYFNSAKLSDVCIYDCAIAYSIFTGVKFSKVVMQGVTSESVTGIHRIVSVGFTLHGVRGRQLTVYQLTAKSKPVFNCGCFIGSEKQLRQYISREDRCSARYRNIYRSRLKAIETAITLLKYKHD